MAGLLFVNVFCSYVAHCSLTICEAVISLIAVSVLIQALVFSPSWATVEGKLPWTALAELIFKQLVVTIALHGIVFPLAAFAKDCIGNFAGAIGVNETLQKFFCRSFDI
ncbi:hypothetical protein AYO44_13365 [Planctomycetaceae bacterium SCGC AG-212-F19]|nr:hypothetical protein AYO44_13365 [Planctomycetaceae bacterium SCGC AG-212-F19]